jgi:CubicO group peptidase (beta-lactamase class C family)
LLLEAGYGMANRKRRIPFTSSTIAQIGSLTKQFTATAILDLVDRKRLRMSDSLGGIFAHVAGQARGITIEMLLMHTSGLAGTCGMDFQPFSKRELLSTCLSRPLIHTPGQVFKYSNLGYSVLGAVVEQLSGAPLESYLKTRFFSPLHIARIGYHFPALPRDSFAVG